MRYMEKMSDFVTLNKEKTPRRFLTVDIGGTFIKYALMNEKKEIFTKAKIPTPQNSREELIAALSAIYHQFNDVRGIAICMPGIIDAKRGYCAMGGALRYNDDFALKDALAIYCPIPIHIENDANCAAYAEVTSGALADVDDAFALIFGTMIGGAYIKDRKLQKGKHFSTGEVSYLILDNKGNPTPDNVWGNACSSVGLVRRYAALKSLDPDKVDGKDIFAAYESKEKEAVEVIDEVTREIAVEIFNIQTLLDVERFALGGGISGQKAFLEGVKKHLEELYERCVYPITRVEVVNCLFENDANLYGALDCFLAEEELSDE